MCEVGELSFFSSLSELFRSPAPPDPAVQAALERILQWVDPMVRAAPRLEKHLTDAVAHALAYCQNVVGQLPGPLAINRQSFSLDPLIHALFATPADIGEMLGRSEAVRDFLGRSESWAENEFYALLAARRRQKTQFGMAQQGEVIRNDVPQKVLYFSDHILIEPHCDLQVTRERLCWQALESLMRTFNNHVEQLRQDRETLRTDISVENAILHPWQEHSKLHYHPAPEDQYARHLGQLDQSLRENGALLTPENLVAQLADFLRQPESALNTSQMKFYIDRLGVIHEPDQAGADVQEISFAEFVSRDRRQHLTTLVRISREEARQAVEMEQSRRARRILI